MDRIAGTIFVQVNGTTYNVEGDWTYDLGVPKRTGLVGADRPHGYKEEPKIPYIEGNIRDSADLDVKVLCGISNATLTVKLANGKTVMFSGAYFAGDGTVGTMEALIKSRWEADFAEEV